MRPAGCWGGVGSLGVVIARFLLRLCRGNSSNAEASSGVERSDVKICRCPCPKWPPPRHRANGPAGVTFGITDVGFTWPLRLAVRKRNGFGKWRRAPWGCNHYPHIVQSLVLPGASAPNSGRSVTPPSPDRNLRLPTL